MADRMLTMWLAAWIVAVPLVHVHPEADHQHGETSHVHGGLAHTVFSSDLPCEYQARDGTLSFAGHSAHEFDHPEIGFSLLAFRSGPECRQTDWG